MAGSPVAASGPKIGLKCYVTTAFPEFPNAKLEERNQKGLADPCLVGGSKEGVNAMSPPHARGSQHQTWGAKSGEALPPLPSRGAQKERKCYPSPAWLGVPNARN